MRQVDIALLLIKQGNNYILQFRDGDPKIGAAGLVGCFGGKIDKGEQPHQTAVREIAEETSLDPKHTDLRSLGVVNVESDHQNEPVRVKAHVFAIDIDSNTRFEAHEGEARFMSDTEIRNNLAGITPATKACFKELIWH